MEAYRSRLTSREVDVIKNQLRQMYKFSHDEYELSKDLSISNEDRQSYYQQACEKIYKVWIHIIELRSGYNITKHSQLTDDFYWKTGRFQRQSIVNFYHAMNMVHDYFYEGSNFPVSNIIESSYKILYNKASHFVDRLSKGVVSEEEY